MSKNYVVIKQDNQECIPITEKKAVIGLETDLTNIDNRLTSLENNQGGNGNSSAVLYTSQSLTPEQKQQARENIGAYAKPSGGIPANDLAPGVLDVSGKEDVSNKVTNWSSTTTDTHYPSEKLVKDSLNALEQVINQGGSPNQIASDWNQTNPQAVDYIKNKPNLSGYEVTSNKIKTYQEFLDSANDTNNTKYPSAKLMYSLIGDIQNALSQL